MEIMFIRHGQTTGDIEDRFGGDYDDELTLRGRNQARELAGQIMAKGLLPDIIYHSPRKRAKQTAEILSAVLGSELKEVNGLRERNSYGILTGMKKHEAREKHPEIVKGLKHYAYTPSRR